MKIQIIKSGSNKAKTYGACPFLVDNPPDGVDVRTPANRQ
jgi:hypothetical protein